MFVNVVRTRLGYGLCIGTIGCSAMGPGLGQVVHAGGTVVCSWVSSSCGGCTLHGYALWYARLATLATLCVCNVSCAWA